MRGCTGEPPMTNTRTNTKDAARKTARRDAGATKRKTSPLKAPTKASFRGDSDNPTRPMATRPRRAASGKAAPAIDAPTTKKQVCLALLSRAEGASIEELKLATGWQTHSVRGFLSGEVRKRMARHLASAVKQGERRYRIAEAKAAS